jgi:hypothetical protein
MPASLGFWPVGLLLLGCGAEADDSSPLCVGDITCPDETEFPESFELSQGGARERVVASGSVEAKLVLTEPSTLLLDLRDLDCGGYRREAGFLSAELAPL